MIGSVGLFDYVRCEYPLPLPDEASEIDMPDWSEFDFQTKSFLLSADGDDEFIAIESYCIDEEGEIYKDVVERAYEESENGFLEIKETNKGIEKVEYTGELLLSGFHVAEKYDCLMEFKALFWKGELKEIKLADWKKEDNADRIKKQKKLEAKFKEAYSKKSSGFRSVWNKIIKFPFLVLKYLIGIAFKIVYKLERWLSF